MAQAPLPVCWDVDRIGDAVTTLAKVSEEKAGYFLATHAPIKHVIGEKGFVSHGGATLREEDIYRQLMDGWERRQPDRDLSVLVWGEAGTGKSHLINWTKLRLDADRAAKEYLDVVPILVRRKSGSLKDALTQIIEQLGGTFGKYLQPVRDAIARLTEETARQQLQLAIALELGPRRAERGRKSLVEVSRKLRHLADACKQRGFGRWLTRSGGVIARTITLLTEDSEVSERDSRPRYTGDDFRIRTAADRSPKDNIDDVQALIDELDSSDSLRNAAAGLLNEALDDAVAEITGLSGGNLNRIFEQIRQDLMAKKRRLALFIEDISVMSVLDLEVVKAVEPRGDESLCPLLAVMGVTDTGMERLRDNDRQRVTHVASLGREAVDQWRSDSEGLAAFTARYLNSVRLTPAEIEKVATHRRETGGDVSISGCTKCPHRTRCHEAFGKRTFDGVDVGLYPFTDHASARLLTRLGIGVNKQLGITQTPRGFLLNVVQPILGDAVAIETHEFPRPETLTHVEKNPPHYWSDFVNKYCGGWSDADTRRARMLAQFWVPVEVNSADAAAQALESFRGVLGLPAFTKKVKRTQVDNAQTTPAVPPPEPPKPKPESVPPALTRTLANLDVWIDRGELKDDERVRRWLAEFIRKCIPWDDLREPPRAVWQSLLRGGDSDSRDVYAFVKVEGQISKPATQKFFVTFPRNEETRTLVEALARFEYLGNRSWSFEGGELHKRVLARWLRAHEKGVVAALQPKVEVSPTAAVGVAVSLLGLAAIVRDRRRLPDSPTDFVAAVLKPLTEGRDKIIRISPRTTDWRPAVREDPTLSEPGRVVALTKRWQDLADNLYLRHHEWLRFIRDELEVPQGRTGGDVNFIDPRPILHLIDPLQRQVSIGQLDGSYFSDFWESRFNRIGKPERYTELPSALADERAEIGRLAGEVRTILEAWGLPVTDPSAAVRAFLGDAAEVFKARQASGVIVADSEFDALHKSQALARRVEMWAQALSEARSVASGSDPLEVLLFDPRSLLDLHSAIRTLDGYLTRLEEEVAGEEAELTVKGDPKEVESQLLSTLDRLAGAAEGSDDDQTLELEESA